MRCTLIALLLLSLDCHATVSADEAYKQSQAHLKNIQKLSTFDERKKIALEFKSYLDKALLEWEKVNPQGASKEEEPVSLLFETLTPVFDLAAKNKKTDLACENAKIAIESADSLGRDEGAPRRKNAKEALEWVKALCK